MNLIQFLKTDGKRAVAAIDDGQARIVKGATSVYALALKAAASGVKLKALVKDKGLGKSVDPAAILADGRMLPPIDHPDPAHLYATEWVHCSDDGGGRACGARSHRRHPAASRSGGQEWG